MDPMTGDIDVAAGPDQDAAVIWSGGNYPEENRVWCTVSGDGGLSWTYPAAASDAPSNPQVEPGAAIDDAGRIYVIWEDCRGPEPSAAYLSRSTDGGLSWMRAVQASAPGQDMVTPDVATNGDGSTLVAVFCHFDELRIYSSYSLDGGLTWLGDIAVGDGLTTAHEYDATVACTGGTSFVAAWHDYRSPGVTRLFVANSSDGGQSWSSPNIPVPSGGHSIFPGSIKLSFDGSSIHLSWIEEYWTGRAEFNEVYYQRSDDLGITWLDEAVRVDTGISPGTARRRPGGIWAQSSDVVFACWMEGNVNITDTLMAVCSRSLDGGQTWEPPVVANPESHEAFRCDIAGDRQLGVVYMAWCNNYNKEIWFARGHEMTGIEEEPSLPSPEILSASPNPCSSMVSISWSGETAEPIKVSDFSGRTIAELETSLGSESTSWDASEAPSGIYLIHFENDPTTTAARVVVIH
jgi:hypothetical protein